LDVLLSDVVVRVDMELRNSNLANDPCAQLEELLPAYGMGLCDPEEVREVEALLEQCPEMREELEEYRQLAAHLPFTAEAKSAPPHLLTQILVAAAADSDQLEFGDGNSAGSATSSPVTRRVPRLTTDQSAVHTTHNANTMQTVKTSRLPDAVETPPTVMPMSRTSSRNTNFWRSSALIASIAAVLALVLFVSANLFWSARLNEQQAAIEETQQLIQTFGTDQVVRFDMGSVDQTSPEARGTVWCHPDNKVALVKAENLPAEAQEQDLKVWLWSGDQREEAGDVWINDRGEGTAVVTASKPMSNYDYVVIAQPSEATYNQQPRPFMRGNLYYGRYPRTEDPPS
jgi:anti-sigma-K factor RskA